MNQIIKNLSEKLSLEKSELLEKLGINENSSLGEIAKSLGTYSIFETKESQTEYIKQKVANKTKESQELEKKYSELEQEFTNFKNNLETQKQENQNYENSLKQVVANAWEKAGILRDFQKTAIDYSKIDFNNLQKSLLQIAQDEGYAIKNTFNFETLKTNEDNEKESNLKTTADGFVIT